MKKKCLPSERGEIYICAVGGYYYYYYLMAIIVITIIVVTVIVAVIKNVVAKIFIMRLLMSIFIKLN
ncbi:MAG: hypothetical protein ACREV6_16850 [Clostridium sp.]|uniref:hypothetical protein n=1 Tax=Clostridium sp. TaxID=1506 RepID=UPI003D6CA11C